MTHNVDPTEARELQSLLKEGFAALSKGKLEQAAACCQQALRIQRDLVPAHFLVGLVSLESKERRTAFSAFQSVVKLDPDHAAAWAQLARLYMAEGQVKMADAALRETRRIKPTDPMVLDLIGTTLSLLGEHGAAGAFYRRADSGQPNHPITAKFSSTAAAHGTTASIA